MPFRKLYSSQNGRWFVRKPNLNGPQPFKTGSFKLKQVLKDWPGMNGIKIRDSIVHVCYNALLGSF
jgi:hypothetical protein